MAISFGTMLQPLWMFLTPDNNVTTQRAVAGQLDSDYLVGYLKGQANATALLDTLFPHGPAMSIVTFAEVYEGIYYGHNPKHYISIFRRFLAGVTVLGVTRSAENCEQIVS